MITRKQFDFLKVGDRVLHAKDYGNQYDLYGCFGTVVERRGDEITVQWDKGLFPRQEYMGGSESLACFDPCTPVSAIHVEEII